MRGPERAAEAPSAAAAAVRRPPTPIPLPDKPGSLRFAVIGDSGRGSTEQYQLAQQMVIQRERFPFDFVLMLGDNIYDSWTPEDYAAKFERPYKALLDDGVTFYAARGNHDGREQWLYPGFNTGGNRYFTFTKTEGVLKPLGGKSVQFFAIDTVDLDAIQLQWLREQLEKSNGRLEDHFFPPSACIRPAVTGCRRSCGGAPSNRSSSKGVWTWRSAAMNISTSDSCRNRVSTTSRPAQRARFASGI